MTIYSGTFGKTNSLTWQYNTDTGLLKIDGSGAMYDEEPTGGEDRDVWMKYEGGE